MPRLLKAPSGQIFRVWSQWAGAGGQGAVLLASSGDGVEWRTLLRVDPADQKAGAQDGSLAVNEAGNLALAYRWTHPNQRERHIRLARSLDAGKTWDVPDDNVSLSGAPSPPQIAWGQGRTLLAAWMSERREGSRRHIDIYTRRSPDGGATWGPEIRMTQSGERRSYAPRLVADGKGRFWLVWISSVAGQSALRLSRSEDDGRTWSAPQEVSGNGFSVFEQSLDVSASNALLLIWREQRTQQPDRLRVLATSSRDGGISWSPIVEVDGLPAAALTNAMGQASGLSRSGEAWVAWHDNRNGRNDIFVARSQDGGKTWGDPQRLDADSAGTAESLSPSLAISSDGATVAVVWEDDRNGLEAVYGRIFSGGQWSPETRLGPALPPKRAARAPRVVSLDQDRFYVVWEVWDHEQTERRRGLASAVIRARPN